MKRASDRTTDEWMSLQAAADALGKSRSKTYALIVKGDLVGQHIAGRTVVSRKSVAAVLEETAAAA